MGNQGVMHTEDWMKIENQISFPLYIATKEIINAYRPFLEPLDLTYTQYIVMLVLWEYGDSSIKLLGQVLSLDSGTLTPLLKKLESKGFVKRKRSAQDERVVIISTTEAGMQLYERAKQVPTKILQRLDGVSFEDLMQYRQLLNKILKALHGDKVQSVDE